MILNLVLEKREISLPLFQLANEGRGLFEVARRVARIYQNHIPGVAPAQKKVARGVARLQKGVARTYLCAICTGVICVERIPPQEKDMHNTNGRRVARRMYLDIETLPAYHWDEERRAAYAVKKVPANYKKPEAIQKWMDSKGSKLWQETSLNPLHGRLCCVCYALDDAEPVLLWADTPETERAALEHVADVINEHGPRLVAHNGFRFDFPYLRARAMSLGMYGLAVRLKKGKPWASSLVDTYYSWTEGARTPGNMTDLCELLGIQDDDTISGADVYRLWATGEEADRALIGDHCLQDVIKLRAVFGKLLKGGYIEGEK